jgi:threonine dehydratase
MGNLNITLGDIYLARHRIASIAEKTPLIPSPSLSKLAGAKIHLKLENHQVTGSFKLRGATNKILSLSEEEQVRGVITVSSGNHGRAVAYVAQKLGVNTTICVPTPVPENKRQAIRDLGAKLVIEGENADEAMQYADKLQAESGMTMVHPFDDLAVIAGQGTISLELLEDFPEIDTIIVPLSGGGLMSGIAFTLKTVKPSIHVIGVSMERGPAMVESLKAGQVVDIIETPTLADALAGGLNQDNRYTLPMVQEFVDETVLVSEEEIANGIAFCVRKHQMVVEGGGVVGVSALLSGKVSNLGEHVVVVISGGNLSMDVLSKLLAEPRPDTEH